MNRLKKSFTALLLCIILIIPQASTFASGDGPGPGNPDEPETGAHGSGSYQLNEVGTDYRFYTEYFVAADTGKSTTSAGVERRTSIKVYANAGEIILFGSSVANSQIDENNKYTGKVTGKDIVITTPGGKKVCEDVLLPGEKDSENNTRDYGLGYIKNPTQEKNGPMVNHSNEANPNDYYVPLQYEVTESGVYTFEFHSVTGFNPSSGAGYHPSPKKASENWSQGNTAVAAWDITVLGKNAENKWVVKSGRAWADYLALTTGGGEGKMSDLDVHVLTHDGFQYKVDFKKAVPYGFIFFANNTGFMTAVTDEDSNITTYRPIYHSFYDSSNDLDYMNSENIYLHKPNEADTATEETYKIFFNAPNEDLNGVSYTTKNGKTETIKTQPSAAVSIDDLKFSGGSHENIARTGHGGYFTFTASDEAMVTIRLDLRKAILDSGKFIEDAYHGSGIVEITVPAVKGENRVYWDGKDTDGVVIPAGIYGNSNVVIATEVKRGELHFPVIDMEGLYGGLTVKRINGDNLDTDDVYNLYYNNNPLAYGTIEGSGNKKVDGPHYVMSDGTKSYKAYTDRIETLSKYFVNGADSISTLRLDDKNYLAKKFFNANSYDSLSDDYKAIIDAEYGTEDATYHFEAINSNVDKMTFKCEGFDGGGNQAGVDAWTYYTQGVYPKVISFAVMDTDARGIVKGQIFYDADISSSYDSTAGDYLLPGVKVRLIDDQGKPLVHTESLPCFDDKGNFVYDKDGKIVHKDTPVIFETVTDSTGTYRFTGVPYSSTGDTTYHVQVQLSDVQSEVLRYTCTTSEDIQSKLKLNDVPFIPGMIDLTKYGADGNKIAQTTDVSKIYGYKYDRDANYDIVFDMNSTQSVTFTSSDSSSSNLVVTKEFNMIGYTTAVPVANQKNYTVKKIWETDSEGNPTHHISDGLIVELWVWNDSAVVEENKDYLTRRTGALMDTQILSESNGWSYTWKNLDNRLQYYVLEYYTKKKDNGEIIYNDKGEPRRVLIGGTLPIFSAIPENHSDKYGFETSLGEYPEAVPDPIDPSKTYIPIQKFGDGKVHPNSITKKEKLESVDNNARQYDVTYKLYAPDVKNNVIELTNSQIFDDRAYYVWLNHETTLPDLIAQTYVDDGGVKNSHSVELQKDKLVTDGEYTIKGLSVSSVDAAKSENVEGNATNAFRIKANSKNALFTATNHGNYKTGTGTRTYQVKYVVDKSNKAPVSVTTNAAGELVLSDNENINVELDSNYIVYSWYMTIHVYDVQSDGVIEYDPNGGTILLQKGLNHGDELTWTLTHDGSNYYSISYTSDDERTSGILQNDTYRLPLYKDAEIPHMGSCADLVGIAYAGSTPVDDISELVFEDTYDSRYGLHDTEIPKEDGQAVAYGNGGYLTASLNTKRIDRINRVQDHINYANVTFTPSTKGKSNLGSGEDVFYYKIIVFAEDSTYQYLSYDDINASEGVVMYAYFTMKPKQITPDEDPDDKPNNNPDNKPNNKPNVDPDDNDLTTTEDESEKPEYTGPSTGDNSHVVFWMWMACACLIALGFCMKERRKRS